MTKAEEKRSQFLLLVFRQQQDRQCTYNVILRRFGKTIVLLETQ
jgi:hypothetical protein